MEEKLEEELISKFKNIEKKLEYSIKRLPDKIQDSNDEVVIKHRIKTYIEKINELKILLAEYEKIALEIEKLSSKKRSGEEISKAVVSLREDETMSKAETVDKLIKEIEARKESNSEKNEEIIIDGKVVGTKKASNKKSFKEL